MSTAAAIEQQAAPQGVEDGPPAGTGPQVTQSAAEGALVVEDTLLRVERDELWAGIETVWPAVDTGGAIQHTGFILIDAQRAGVYLAASDLSMHVTQRLEAEVVNPGAVAVPAQALRDLVRAWPSGKVEVQRVSGRVTLVGSWSTRARYSLPTLPGDQFPLPPDVSGPTFVLGEGVADMVRRTAFVVAKDDTRPHLCGVLWRVWTGRMEMVATDGHRFAYARKAFLDMGPPRRDVDAIVPPKAMSFAASMPPDASAEVTVGDSAIAVIGGGTRMVSRLIEGPYPRFESVLPQDPGTCVTVSVTDLHAALRRAQAVVPAVTFAATLSLRPGRLEVHVADQARAQSADETIEVDYDGADVDVAVNVRYLLEIIKRLDVDARHAEDGGTGLVTLALRGRVLPMTILPAGPDGPADDYYLLLMPLRPTA